jgi:hypothetical protein
VKLRDAGAAEHPHPVDLIEFPYLRSQKGKSMNKRSYVPVVLALVALGWVTAHYPPFQITWQRFFLKDPSPLTMKLAFLFKVYAVPCLLSLVAVVLYQLQGKMGALGAPGSSVFPLALLASGCMMSAFRSMVSGVGGVPGYAMGMALGYTLMSRVHSFQPSGRVVFGRPMLRIVWRGELAAQKAAAALLQAREEPGSSAHLNVASSTSNSARNSSLSLGRAEAGI